MMNRENPVLQVEESCQSTGLTNSDKEYIKELALASGFKLKEQDNGRMDLNPYVYEFAQRLLAQAK